MFPDEGVIDLPSRQIDEFSQKSKHEKIVSGWTYGFAVADRPAALKKELPLGADLPAEEAITILT